MFTFLSFGSFSQTNAELLKMGDAAMINGQYTNAVYYYAFILYKVKQGEEAAYYPYEITTTYKEPKKNVKKLNYSLNNIKQKMAIQKISFTKKPLQKLSVVSLH
jgi:hypothetical protein